MLRTSRKVQFLTKKIDTLYIKRYSPPYTSCRLNRNRLSRHFRCDIMNLNLKTSKKHRFTGLTIITSYRFEFMKYRHRNCSSNDERMMMNIEIILKACSSNKVLRPSKTSSWIRNRSQWGETSRRLSVSTEFTGVRLNLFKFRIRYRIVLFSRFRIKEFTLDLGFSWVK